MEIHRTSEDRCPAGIIAVAINGDNDGPHCGIVYTSLSGAICLCETVIEGAIQVRKLPNHFYWTPTNLEPDEALQIMVFIEFVTAENRTPVPYSFIYPDDAFDAVGRIRAGVGFTCATFVSAIFDHFKYNIVDVTTWRARRVQDPQFRSRIIELAENDGYSVAAARLRMEAEHFRLKPWELFGSATHSRYPVRFVQARKLAKIVTKLMRKMRHLLSP